MNSDKKMSDEMNEKSKMNPQDSTGKCIAFYRTIA